MRKSLLILGALALCCRNAMAHPEPGDSVERIPPGTELTALRDINIKPRTRRTLLADGSYSCTLHHDISEDDRSIGVGTLFVLGKLEKSFYGPRGDLFEAHFEVRNFGGMSLECSGERGKTLPIIGMTSILRDVFRFKFPLPKDIRALGPAAAALAGAAPFR